MVGGTFKNPKGKSNCMMLFVLFLAFPLQILAAQPSPELTKKCEAALADLQPLVAARVFASLEEQKPAIIKALATHNLIINAEVLTFVRVQLAQSWWAYKGYKRLDKSWVQPQRLKPYRPADSELLQDLLLKYDSHHE